MENILEHVNRNEVVEIDDDIGKHQCSMFAALSELGVYQFERLTG